MPPVEIDGNPITGATIDGTDVQEITVDGTTVFSAGAGQPPHYSKLTHWWDFSADNTTTTFVEDKSNDNNDLTQGPGFSFDTINGVQSGDFDGNTQYIRNDGAFATAPFSIFMVIDVDDTVTNFQRMFHGGSNSYDVRVNGTEFNIQSNFGDSISDTIVGVVNQQSNGTYEARTDGVSHGTLSTVLTPTIDNVTLGDRFPDQPVGEDGYDGSIGSCLIYDQTLSSSEVNDIETFLANKWGVSI